MVSIPEESRAKRLKSDLAFGSQFSPSQIDLAKVLTILVTLDGTPPEFTERIRQDFFSKHANGDKKQQTELAKNVRLALKEYGIVGDDEKITATGKTMIEVKSDPGKLHDSMAKQILMNLHGLDLLKAIQTLKVLKEEPTLIALAKELERNDIHVPPSGTHISTMKQWLQRAGILGEDLSIHDDRLKSLIGYGLEETDTLASFSQEERAFIKALAALAPTDWTASSIIANYAHIKYHVDFDLKNLRQQIIFPLGEAGYIEYRKSTSGRGAKPYEIKPTAKFQAEFIIPLLEILTKVGGVPYEAINKPISEIVKDLSDEKRHVKGKALELLVLHLCRLLDLRLIGWRHRWKDTGGAEVDVLAEGTNFVFTRWEIQCKNTARVALEDIAREVGMADFYHANVVMIVTTGKFAKPARDFAERKMEKSSLNLVLLDGTDIAEIVRFPHSIGAVLRKHAQKVMKLKKLKDIPS